MENILPIHLQEVIFSSSDSKQGRVISKLLGENLIRKIAPRIYSGNLIDAPEVIIRRNLFNILGKLYPKAMLSHRSALEFQPTVTGNIFLTFTYTKKIYLPGVTIRFLEGQGPINGDIPFVGELYYSQLERALLENLQPARQPGPDSKTLTLPEIENRLEHVLNNKGEIGLNELRDRARFIADQLGLQSEFKKLNKLIGALLNTRPVKILSSPLAIARVLGAPYDPTRLELFEKLFVQLKQNEFPYRPERNIENQAFKNFAFFEAYFSNYIEGTIFEIEEAKKIIETETPIPTRDEDSHDILGTYRLVSNHEEMKTIPGSPDELLSILRYRHKVLLAARTSKNPGQYRDKNNQAGETHFVDHTLVKGTLIKGFDFYQALVDPFAKSAFMMFMISEVHPFLDGNGRISRIMMNAEFVKAGQTRIIIPTVFREDYLLTLRKLTRDKTPEPYIRMLDKAQKFSETVVGSMDFMQSHLEKCNAFKEPTDAKLKIIDNIK
ncbi:MAG: Fic family protein [Bacteroidales bacterium]|nr:Fic family protein [Bacteroidales bacterium]